MTNHLKPDPSKDVIISVVKRNDISEMTELYIRYGVGSPTILNFNWHIRCWIKANLESTRSNVHTTWWCKRIILLDAILKHPSFKDNTITKTMNLPCVTLQLMEVN